MTAKPKICLLDDWRRVLRRPGASASRCWPLPSRRRKWWCRCSGMYCRAARSCCWPSPPASARPLRASWRSRRCTDDPATITSDAQDGGRTDVSAAALVGIVLHEGYTDRAVIPVKGDVPTIGFGTTTGVKLGDTTTPPKALARALTDVQQFEGAQTMRDRAAGPARVRRAGELFLQRRQPRVLPVHAGQKTQRRGLRRGLCRAAALALLPGQRLRAAHQRALCGGLATRREAEYRQCIGEAS